MTATRRGVLYGAAAGVGLALAGCIDRTVASFEATPATVAPSRLRGTDYVEAGVDEQVLSQGVGPVRRVVEVRNWVARYERGLSPSVLAGMEGETPTDESLALFVVLSTPEVTVEGRNVNPVAGFSANDIVTQVQDVYGGLREVERVDDRTVTCLGTETRVVEYRGAGSIDGADELTTEDGEPRTDLSLHVSDPVAHAGDFVLAVAAHPQGATVEARTVDRLLAGVRHGDAQES